MADPRPDKATPAASPATLAKDFAEAWNRKDADRLAALFTEDADFVNVVGLWWRRRRDIRKAHAYALQRYFRATTLDLERVVVKQLGPEVATVHASWTLTGQERPDGTTAEPRRDILLLVAVRDGAGWLVAAAQNTDLAADAETRLAEGGGLRPVSYDG